MRLPIAIFGVVILAFTLPDLRRRWEIWRRDRALRAARLLLDRDALAAKLFCVDPETDVELDLRVEGGGFGIFCVASQEPCFALLLQLSSAQYYYSLSSIATVAAGERSRIRDESGSPLMPLPGILPEGEIRFDYAGRLFYAVIARTREPLELLLHAEMLGGIPMQTFEGLRLAQVPKPKQAGE